MIAADFNIINKLFKLFPVCQLERNFNILRLVPFNLGKNIPYTLRCFRQLYDNIIVSGRNDMFF